MPAIRYQYLFNFQEENKLRTNIATEANIIYIIYSTQFAGLVEYHKVPGP